MKIELRGWSSEGLRCPDVAVDLLAHGEIPPVSLIQMPNGTGKTTTLELLRATLDGGAKQWAPADVRRFQRPHDTSARGSFKVDLLVDERPLTFELILDYTEGQAFYRTTDPATGGVKSGYHPPPQVYPFLRSQFINLFVFDGEFAGRLLDVGKSEAEKAIDALCQLYLLNDVAETADDAWKRAARGGNPRTTTGLAGWERAQTRIATRITQIETAQSQSKGELEGLKLRIEKLKEVIATHMARSTSDNTEYESAQRALADSEKRVEALTGELMQFVRRPDVLHSQIATSLQMLKSNLDSLKLPENTSAQFFQDLLREDTCICGREMNEKARTEITVRSKDYLGAEENGLINAMKTDIDKFIPCTGAFEPDVRLASCIKALGDAVRDRQRATGTVSALRQKRIEQGDDKLLEWQTELQNKTAEIKEIENVLKEISAPADDSEDTEKTFSLALLRKRLAEANRKVSEITETVTIHRQTELLKDIVSEARELARNRIRGIVLTECNNRLNKVLAHDPVQLERIDRSLHLAHQAGASVGQTLAVGYIFLMTVLERGQNKFPLIVDSPAGPLDAGRRRAIGELLPKLTSQFVGLVISVEKLGFVSSLEGSASKVKYLTVFRKTPGTKQWVDALPEKGVAQSNNAAIVEGRDYFNEFDLVEEAHL
ncbi:hypothetical protein [Rhizomicrobium electricum]|uniref:Rad50/SbcC-type AAA domain-containing protein n=1 Tax=Rhizomicrobium electricum TaxID=480070 RepID=A0ABN1F335_9PROT|nr:hypothetical protein [Rhizomicrobium electricum]NIJ50367.1 DNA sulfur modification protein DndD [Rhizomicrobium electricum]